MGYIKMLLFHRRNTVLTPFTLGLPVLSWVVKEFLKLLISIEAPGIFSQMKPVVINQVWHIIPIGASCHISSVYFI
jgi:hypothetical protein